MATMVINTYKVSDDPRKINKTLGTVNTVPGELKEGCTLHNPVITLSFIIGTGSKPNYAYIDAFKRYYFIDDIEFKGGYRFVTATLRLDVLMSFKDKILAGHGIINKTENYQAGVPNPGITVSNKSQVYTDSFTDYTGFKNDGTGRYVLTVLG